MFVQVTSRRPRPIDNAPGTVAQTQAAGNGPAAGVASAAAAQSANLDVRRSTRIRKVRGEKEAVVSSDLTLLQLKLKVRSCCYFIKTVRKFRAKKLADV